ncbi:MAG: T9SS type A sorting domain-containing protein [Bacteroidia bacterium]|nr:T9SS type A sorting domain-containing protein [Bacteroidia bacterium]
MKRVFYIFLFLVIAKIALPQISTSGCTLNGGMSLGTACANGCISGCNLTAYNFFGTQCNGTAITGSCPSQTLVTNFTLPAGCTAEIVAEFKKRGASCPSSGADAGDQLFLQGFGGSFSSAPNPTTTNGSGNMDITMSFTQTGGSFAVGGVADRRDEIITWTITLTGTCGSGCNGVLPITLKDFYAEPLQDQVLLKWEVSTERNVAYYLLEKSTDGINFKPLNTIASLATSAGNNNLSYFNYDNNPIRGINYYRLKNVDFDGTIDTHKAIAVDFKNVVASFWINQMPDQIKIGYDKLPLSKSIFIYDISGRQIKEILLKAEAPAINEILTTGLERGIYIISGSESQDGLFQKLIIK